MNLISDPIVRATYSQAIADLHDTFGRPITVWKTPQQIVVSTDPNYNGFYGNQANDPTVQIIPQSGVFIARVKYLTAQEILQSVEIERQDQQKIQINLGGVRIRVSGDAKAFIDDCEKITFDGEVMRVLQRDRPHSLLDTAFYDYILQRVP